MPINLDAPLSFKNADAQEKAMLDDLQGNILKGHGRENTFNVFLRFDPAQAAGIKAWIKKQIVPVISTASAQFKAIEKFKKKGIAAGNVFFFFLTKAGYDALGVATGSQPGDGAFQAGMQARQAILHDTKPADWDDHFQGQVHAMFLIGGALKEVKAAFQDWQSKLPPGVKILGREIGKAWKNPNHDGIEHFGYVDGRSQPLMLVEDVEHEKLGMDGTSVWNPAFPLKQALVPDPMGEAPTCFGSYFVFRKLEQNVKGFKAMEKKLAKALGLKGDDAERAGAMVVGRFEDGTPLVLQLADGMKNPVPNNFNYKDDPGGLKCPFQAHIRKTNPRGESVGPFAPTEEAERTHIMARRGITYGTRKVKLVGKGVEFLDEPQGDVGLLFMAYQNNIGNQFEFTQSAWANNPGFVKTPHTGVDPVIGQVGMLVPPPQKWRDVWGNDPHGSFTNFDFKGFVTLKGGEYFFAPSISGLKNL